MSTSTITFGLTLQNDEGTVDFNITRADGISVFTDQDDNTQMTDEWEQDNIGQSTSIDLDLPTGDYEIYLDLVTNVNFDFSVSGVLTSLTPTPKTVSSTTNMIYKLKV